MPQGGGVPPAGPPFAGLQATLAAIGTAREASWTVFYEVQGMPSVPGWWCARWPA
ncbi:hypothetical protein AW27_033620 [Streptomyces sp. PCS3-D2]|uniref:hypothetical protein n=1 Tax=Streptomyces sp. PCS3-D2 TaxID=1460244 RepID=UPI00272B222D|nr:hypothetical protein [Streptomyces sp. PCS3-D2]WKV76511.1 hypothetical protein AW27_033620 [Streptomyces sp. PCS3-D2]